MDLEVGLLGSSQLAQFQLLDSEYWSVVEGSGLKLLGRVQLRAELPDGTHRRFTVMTSGFASFRRAGLIATGDYVGICKHHIHHRDVVETLKGILEHESLAQD